MVLIPPSNPNDNRPRLFSHWLNPRPPFGSTSGTDDQQPVEKLVRGSVDKGEGAPALVEGAQGLAKVSAEMGAPGDPLFTEAITLLRSGVDGDKQAVVKAYQQFEKLRETNPQDPLLLAYCGTATSLLGRDAIDPTVRLAKILEGLKMLDRAVSSAPDHIQVRVLRSAVCYRLPETYFHRTKTAVEDFEYLVSRYQDDNTAISEELVWQVLYDLGTAYKRTGHTQEAKAAWSELLSLTTDPKYTNLLANEGLHPNPEVRSAAESPVNQEHNPAEEQEKKTLIEEVVHSPARQETAPAPGYDVKQVIEEGIKLHARALAGDRNITVKAFEFFSKVHEDYPDDDQVAAYYADCLSMTGRDAEDPALRFRNAYEAIRILDQAVLNSPDDVGIRLLRANHGFRLPEAFFHRTATAGEDFAYLIQRYEQDNTVFSQETYWQLLYDQGLAYRRLENEEAARQEWQKLLSLDPPPKYKAIIQEQQFPDIADFGGKAASLNSKADLLREGKRLLGLGAAGNAAAAKKACELLRQANELQPNNPLTMAYYGSSLALVGRDALDPRTMFGNAYKGLKMLKIAAALNPDNPEILLLRAFLTFSLPESYFHLTASAIEDLRFVRAAYEQDQNLFSQEVYWKVLYSLGAAYQRVGDKENGRAVWSELLANNPDSKYRELVQHSYPDVGER